MLFDRVKQSIGFRFFKITHHYASMTLGIQFLLVIIENMCPRNTSEHFEVAYGGLLSTPFLNWSHMIGCLIQNKVQEIVIIVNSLNPKLNW